MNIRRWGIACGLLLVLVAAGWTVWNNEKILREGKVVLLELAPVDPRSLMQGDYMALRFALADEARNLYRDTRDATSAANLPETLAVSDGYLIVRINENRVASLVRLVGNVDTLNASALNPDEVAIYYRMREGSLKLATNAFFFQEGKAAIFEEAKYGEFRVGANGEPRLVGMRNKKLELLGNE